MAVVMVFFAAVALSGWVIEALPPPGLAGQGALICCKAVGVIGP